MNCKNCGAPLHAEDQFCKKCGTAVPAQPEKPQILQKLSALWDKCKSNRVLLLAIAGGVLLLVLALILIISAASCSRAVLKTPEDAANAVLAALEKGDGDTLYSLTKTAVPLLGQHPEQFGEGDTPENVMRGYYRTLADELHARLTQTFGKGYQLEAQLSTELVADTGVFTPNRALNIEAEQYAIVSGPLSVSGTAVGTLRLVAALQGGEWKLLVVYVC